MRLTNTVGGEQSTSALGDKVMLGSIAFCAGASLIIGWSFGEIGMAMGLSVLLLLLGGVAMAFDSQGKARRSVLTFVLVAFVALHIQLSRGMLEFHFGVFVVLAFCWCIWIGRSLRWAQGCSLFTTLGLTACRPQGLGQYA